MARNRRSRRQRHLRLGPPSGNGGPPKVRISPLFTREQVQEAIDDLRRQRAAVDGDIALNTNAISDLAVRKQHYHSLIAQGKFNKQSMEGSITQMDVEIRRYQDKNAALAHKQKELGRVLVMLRGRLAEMDAMFGE